MAAHPGPAAVLIGPDHAPLASGSHDWENQFVDRLWTYSLEAVWSGIQECYAALAQDVILRDEGVDQMYNALFREILTFMLEDPRTITPAMHLHFIAKNLERMGDLVTNMAEQVIYLVTGEKPQDERPKGDRTAFMGGPGMNGA